MQGTRSFRYPACNAQRAGGQVAAGGRDSSTRWSSAALPAARSDAQQRRNGWIIPCNQAEKLLMTTVLITGANRGIGLALTRLYRERGDAVIGACREASPELAATGARVEAGVDVREEASVQALAQRLDGTRIDLLVLNAGILRRDDWDELGTAAFEAMREQYEVNALGPLRVARALDEHLAPEARIGIITSRMGSVGDNQSGGSYGYRASKAAVNAIGRSMAMDLQPRGIAVFLLHPGFVSTDMVGGRGEISPEQAARQLAARLDSLGLAETGTFWHSNGSPLPW